MLWLATFSLMGLVVNLRLLGLWGSCIGGVPVTLEGVFESCVHVVPLCEGMVRIIYVLGRGGVGVRSLCSVIAPRASSKERIS